MLLYREALGDFHGSASIRTIGGRTQYFRFIANQNAIWEAVALAVESESFPDTIATGVQALRPSPDFHLLTLRISRGSRRKTASEESEGSC